MVSGCHRRQRNLALSVLALRKGSILSKTAFLNHLHGRLDEPERKIVDVLMCKLLSKLELAGATGVNINTGWGPGYALRETTHAVARPFLTHRKSPTLPTSGWMRSPRPRCPASGLRHKSRFSERTVCVSSMRKVRPIGNCKLARPQKGVAAMTCPV